MTEEEFVAKENRLDEAEIDRDEHEALLDEYEHMLLDWELSVSSNRADWIRDQLVRLPKGHPYNREIPGSNSPLGKAWQALIDTFPEDNELRVRQHSVEGLDGWSTPHKLLLNEEREQRVLSRLQEFRDVLLRFAKSPKNFEVWRAPLDYIADFLSTYQDKRLRLPDAESQMIQELFLTLESFAGKKKFSEKFDNIESYFWFAEGTIAGVEVILQMTALPNIYKLAIVEDVSTKETLKLSRFDKSFFYYHASTLPTREELTPIIEAMYKRKAERDRSDHASSYPNPTLEYQVENNFPPLVNTETHEQASIKAFRQSDHDYARESYEWFARLLRQNRVVNVLQRLGIDFKINQKSKPPNIPEISKVFKEHKERIIPFYSALMKQLSIPSNTKDIVDFMDVWGYCMDDFAEDFEEVVPNEIEKKIHTFSSMADNLFDENFAKVWQEQPLAAFTHDFENKQYVVGVLLTPFPGILKIVLITSAQDTGEIKAFKADEFYLRSDRILTSDTKELSTAIDGRLTKVSEILKSRRETSPRYILQKTSFKESLEKVVDQFARLRANFESSAYTTQDQELVSLRQIITMFSDQYALYKHNPIKAGHLVEEMVEGKFLIYNFIEKNLQQHQEISPENLQRLEHIIHVVIDYYALREKLIEQYNPNSEGIEDPFAQIGVIDALPIASSMLESVFELSRLLLALHTEDQNTLWDTAFAQVDNDLDQLLASLQKTYEDGVDSDIQSQFKSLDLNITNIQSAVSWFSKLYELQKLSDKDVQPYVVRARGVVFNRERIQVPSGRYVNDLVYTNNAQKLQHDASALSKKSARRAHQAGAEIGGASKTTLIDVKDAPWSDTLSQAQWLKRNRYSDVEFSNDTRDIIDFDSPEFVDVLPEDEGKYDQVQGGKLIGVMLYRTVFSNVKLAVDVHEKQGKTPDSVTYSLQANWLVRPKLQNQE